MGEISVVRREGPIAPYLIAAGFVGAAAIVHFIVDPFIHPSSPYALFYLAILACAWFYGVGPAVLAAVMSAVVVEGFLIANENWSPLRMLPFTLACIGIVAIARLAYGIRSRESRVNAHLAAILNSTDDAMVSKDLNGIIQNCNPACERLFGYNG